MPNAVSPYSPPPPSHGPFHSPDWSPPPYPNPGPAGPPVMPGFYPISVSRGLSLAFNMYRFGWRTFVAISLIMFVPITVIQAIVSYATVPAISAWQFAASGNPFGPRPDPQVLLATFPLWAFGLIILVALLVGPISTVGGAALINAAVAAIRGERLSVRASYGAAIRRLPSLLALYLIVTVGGLFVASLTYIVPISGVIVSALGVSGGPIALLGLIVLVAFVFACFYVAIRIALCIPALMVEGAGAADALRRSWYLLGGSMLRLIGWVLLFALIVGLLSLLIEIPGVILAFLLSPPRLTDLATTEASFATTFTLVQTVISLIAAAVFQPLTVIGTTLLYLEIRWRHGEQVPAPGQPYPPEPSRAV